MPVKVKTAPIPGAPEGSRRLSIIANAMREGKTVSFVYDGQLRVVEAHAVGVGPKGTLLMRGYQVSGHSSRPLPHWGLFTIAKMELLDFGKEASRAPREGYRQGDKGLTLIAAEIVL